MTNSPSATGELNENCKVELLPTIVKPVSFDPYSPEDLTQVEGKFVIQNKQHRKISNLLLSIFLSELPFFYLSHLSRQINIVKRRNINIALTITLY